MSLYDLVGVNSLNLNAKSSFVKGETSH